MQNSTKIQLATAIGAQILLDISIFCSMAGYVGSLHILIRSFANIRQYYGDISKIRYAICPQSRSAGFEREGDSQLGVVITLYYKLVM